MSGRHAHRARRRWIEFGAAVVVLACAAVVGVAVRAGGRTDPVTGTPVSSDPAVTEPPPTADASPQPPRYVFPVTGPVSYSALHHDYPAADIMAGCGLPMVAVTDGMILETTTTDLWNRAIDAGETRGGLSVSLLGDDGVRYYGSHLSIVDSQITAGVRVTAGQRLGLVGETGDASACHLHFGLSPPCARVGDWWTRRGVIPPAPYLDDWRAGGSASPVAEITAWREQQGCPTGPTVLP